MSSIRVDAGHFGNLGTDYLSLRRSVDVLAATILVVVLSPVLLVTALLVLVLMGRQIFFRQVRIGHRGPFVLYKFRTMVRDAEAIGGGYNAEQLHLIPPLGVRLRASSPDELPQLFNILRGDMTFIGPRPAMPDQVARYTARIVVDPVAYGHLCGEWESRTGRRVAAGMDAFFPAYRQP